ncbi:MAG: pilus assembly protein [Anaerolineae bacterium]|nr:pilus assembly protein [Anaerolineae bacterium]
MNVLCRSQKIRDNEGEHGQALVEFVLILPFLFLILAALIYFGRLIYATIALDMASYDACRAAVESLRRDDGQIQGLTAGRETLNGFSLSAASARLTVVPQGKWDRGAWVRCRTGYTMKVNDIPMVQLFHPGGAVPLKATRWSRIETWRSWWER